MSEAAALAIAFDIEPERYSTGDLPLIRASVKPGKSDAIRPSMFCNGSQFTPDKYAFAQASNAPRKDAALPETATLFNKR